MSEATNVVPLHPEHEELQKKSLEFIDWLRGEVEANRISALSVCGVCDDGDTFDHGIIPLNAPTLRYVLIGQLEDAKAYLTGAP